MKKSNLKFLVPLIITLTILTVIKIMESEEVDWNTSFAKKDKIPYGGYIIYDLSDELFPNQEVTLKEFPIYNILKNNFYSNTNYVFINSYFAPDRLDTDYLLQYVEDGNNAFVSAFGIYGSLADSLQIETHDEFFSEDSVNTNFSIAELKSDTGWTYYTGNFKNSLQSIVINCFYATMHGK